MSKHTPGPWTRFGNEVYGGDGSRVAEAVAVKDMPLVLQAPEMYEALRLLLKAVTCNAEGGRPRTADEIYAMAGPYAQTALAKAEGSK